MWDLPRPGLKPVSPALAGGFLTTAPPGKPLFKTFLKANKIYDYYYSLQCDFWMGFGIPYAKILWCIKIKDTGTSLVAQWLRIHLPMQGIWVRALVWEDPTCHVAAKPTRHTYWACALEPASHNYWARVPELLKSVCLEPMLCNKRSHHNEKPAHRNEE